MQHRRRYSRERASQSSEENSIHFSFASLVGMREVRATCPTRSRAPCATRFATDSAEKGRGGVGVAFARAGRRAQSRNRGLALRYFCRGVGAQIELGGEHKAEPLSLVGGSFHRRLFLGKSIRSRANAFSSFFPLLSQFLSTLRSALMSSPISLSIILNDIFS